MVKRRADDSPVQPADPARGLSQRGPCRRGRLADRLWPGLAGIRHRWHRGRGVHGAVADHALQRAGALTLSAVPGGTSVQIRAVQGGHIFLSRLACLGFTPGASLRVIQNYGHGPLIVALRDSRVALGRGEASRILVEPLAGAGDGV